jgi:alginate O-acetyltransferase complex protein AlgI
MIFSTSVFVFGFLPLFLTIYFLSPWRARSFVILVASYAFYGWWRIEYLLLIFSISMVSYLMAGATHRWNDQRLRKSALIAGLVFDLGALAYFKYANFFANIVDGVLRFSGGDGLSLPEVLLPIGISFHTFQSISYLVDVYRKDTKPAQNVIDFLAFGAMFPQLIAGPVLRYKDVADQFVSRSISLEKFTAGVYRFVTGLAMKVLVADSIAPLADRIFALPNPSFMESWLGAIAYTFQLFFDFAGYSAMAIGLALMMGFRFMENFDAPYIARSITEFWKRWHISLSTWLRDYLYIPLGGNKRGARRTYINLILTMLLGGLWHGANFTFLLWGAWHGTIMAIERALGAKNRETVWPTTIALPLTFLFVVLGWVVFRAPDLTKAIEFYAGMVGLNGFGIGTDLAWQLRKSEFLMLAVAVLISFWPALDNRPILKFDPAMAACGHGTLLLLSMTKLVADTSSPFLYFQF